MKPIVTLFYYLKRVEYRQYFYLCRPKLLGFILFCAGVGILLSFDGPFYWSHLYADILPGMFGILFAMAAGVLYHRLLTEPNLGNVAGKTNFIQKAIRPNLIPRNQVCCFCILLSLTAVMLLAWVNPLILLLVWFIFFSQAIFYAQWKKKSYTNKNLFTAFIFSLAPILGWGIVSSDWKPQIFSLALVIFFWVQVYSMTSGIKTIDKISQDHKEFYQLFFIRKKIFLGTAMVYIFAMSPFLFHLSGEVYILGAFILGVGFLQKSFALLVAKMEQDIIRLSELLRHYAIYYLPSLFVLMVVDHWLFFSYV